MQKMEHLYHAEVFLLCCAITLRQKMEVLGSLVETAHFAAGNTNTWCLKTDVFPRLIDLGRRKASVNVLLVDVAINVFWRMGQKLRRR